MNAKELKPIFDYFDGFRAEMNQRFDDVDERFDKVDKKLAVIENSLHGLAKEVRDFRDEHIVLYHKIETLQTWAKQVSKKLGIPLPL